MSCFNSRIYSNLAKLVPSIVITEASNIGNMTVYPAAAAGRVGIVETVEMGHAAGSRSPSM